MHVSLILVVYVQASLKTMERRSQKKLQYAMIGVQI